MVCVASGVVVRATTTTRTTTSATTTTGLHIWTSIHVQQLKKVGVVAVVVAAANTLRADLELCFLVFDKEQQ